MNCAKVVKTQAKAINKAAKIKKSDDLETQYEAIVETSEEAFRKLVCLIQCHLFILHDNEIKRYVKKLTGSGRFARNISTVELAFSQADKNDANLDLLQDAVDNLNFFRKKPRPISIKPGTIEAEAWKKNLESDLLVAKEYINFNMSPEESEWICAYAKMIGLYDPRILTLANECLLPVDVLNYIGAFSEQTFLNLNDREK